MPDTKGLFAAKISCFGEIVSVDFGVSLAVTSVFSATSLSDSVLDVEFCLLSLLISATLVAGCSVVDLSDLIGSEVVVCFCSETELFWAIAVSDLVSFSAKVSGLFSDVSSPHFED